MKSLCFLLFLFSLVLAEVYAAHVPSNKRGHGPGTVPVQPVVLVPVANRRSAQSAAMLPSENEIPEQAAIVNEDYELNNEEEEQEEGDQGLGGYIPITDGNGGTYLLAEGGMSAMGDLGMMENQGEEEEEESEVLIPTGSMEIYGGEVFDSKTGENAILVPEDIIANLSENDVIALVENPDDIANSRKLIITRRRRRPYQSYAYSRPHYYHKSPRPVRPLPPPPPPYYHYRGAQRKGAIIKFGPVRVIAYLDGRKRVLFN